MRAHARELAAAVLFIAAIAGLWTAAGLTRTADASGAEISQLRGWARTEAAAGISVLPKRVPTADPRQIRDLEGLPGFHTFAMRCSSCHELPDPAAYDGRQWASRIDEMQEHVRRSGLMPPTDEELRTVRTFLEIAADRSH